MPNCAVRVRRSIARVWVWCGVMVGVSSLPPQSYAAPATPEQIETLPGFKVESILTADPKVNGSWISMAKDNQGRLLLAGQRGHPITRVTIKDGQVYKQEDLHLPISEGMGMLYAFDSLYIDGAAKVKDGKVLWEKDVKPGDKTPTIFGMFRCRSSKGDDNYDQVEFLREWEHGAGEHGSHGIVLGPDKKLYIVCGNFTGVPTDILPTSPHRNYQDDLALPRAEDGNGFGAGKVPPGGYVVRMDENGKNVELFASGQRNTYDIAFNADGELFGFDSDMEWDWGTPWYRPIRVFHGVSGGDTGFREGTAKWPEYYADSLPAAVNIGIGCPTGVVFGTGAKFPAKYQKAMFVLDWTYGRLIAVHLTPNGASYTGSWENFVAPKGLKANGQKVPLNLTDAVIGADGAMYFTIGGRNTAANLYRVTYTGSDSTAPATVQDSAGAEARELRHQLETFHGRQDARAVEVAWPQLNNPDRFIRYAARIAIEAQPVEQWKAKALAETQPEAGLVGLLALARLGGAGAQGDILKALEKFPFASLNETQALEKLRVIEVSIARQGKPSGGAAQQVIAELSPAFPAKSQTLNRELCQVLLAVEAPDAVSKTVKLLAAAPTQEEQLVYVLALRTVTAGWTPELRKQFFSWWPHKEGQHPDFVMQWFADAGRPYADGSSYPRFVGNLRGDAVKVLPADDAALLAPVLALYTPPGAKQPKKATKARTLVQEWKTADLEPSLAKVSKGRNFAKGKAAFEEAQCLACHRFGNEGGAVGPDLTAIASRFARKDILESITEPSKVVSEQYMNTIVKTKGNDVFEGRVVEEDDQKIVIQPNPLAPEKVEVKKSDVKSRGLSKLSPMPEGLVNTFGKDEILDLIAYVESAGRKDHPDFAK